MRAKVNLPFDRVTAGLLDVHGACPDAVHRFSRVFPDGCDATAAGIRKAAEECLDLDWFAGHVLWPFLKDAPVGFRRVRAKASRDRTAAAEKRIAGFRRTIDSAENRLAAGEIDVNEYRALVGRHEAAYFRGRVTTERAYQTAVGEALIEALGLDQSV